MIQKALSCLAEELNEYVKLKMNLSEDCVVLTAIVNQDGSLAIQGANKLTITLINIEIDSNLKTEAGSTSKDLGNSPNTSSINLHILIAAYFNTGNYAEGLTFISLAIAYLQAKTVFTRSNTPRLDTGIDQLIFELESPSFDKMNHIWSTLGAKYMPSVMYKVHILTEG